MSKKSEFSFEYGEEEQEKQSPVPLRPKKKELKKHVHKVQPQSEVKAVEEQPVLPLMDDVTVTIVPKPVPIENKIETSKPVLETHSAVVEHPKQQEKQDTPVSTVVVATVAVAATTAAVTSGISALSKSALKTKMKHNKTNKKSSNRQEQQRQEEHKQEEKKKEEQTKCDAKSQEVQSIVDETNLSLDQLEMNMLKYFDMGDSVKELNKKISDIKSELKKLGKTIKDLDI